MFHRILLPLDGSGSAESVLSNAERLAEEIVLLQVVPLPDRGELLLDGPCLDAERYLDEIELRLHREGVRVRRLVRLGKAADTIVEVAKQVGASLIAMSTNRPWGSVAGPVVTTGTTPLLIHRSQHPRKELRTILTTVAPLPCVDELAQVFGARVHIARTEDILTAAAACQADLIVMPCGAPAEAVLRATTVPMLLVR